MATAKEPFITPGIFRDRNFLTGLFFIFTISTILFSGMALLPPLLEHLYGYPTILTGMVLAPRGAGTMIAMLIVGRLSGKVDARLLILFGLALTIASLWQMTSFAMVMGMSPIIISGVIQGFGLGFVFIPLSTLAFATLAPRMRTEGTSLFSLIRNLGSSIGISVMVTLLSRNTAISQAEITTRITPFTDIPANDAISSAALASGDPTTSALLASEIGRQASMIAYLDDFKLMMLITAVALPLLLLLRKPRHQPGPRAREEAASAVME
jgi:DHA2 family multidrug resistance protein